MLTDRGSAIILKTTLSFLPILESLWETVLLSCLCTSRNTLHSTELLSYSNSGTGTLSARLRTWHIQARVASYWHIILLFSAFWISEGSINLNPSSTTLLLKLHFQRLQQDRLIWNALTRWEVVVVLLPPDLPPIYHLKKPHGWLPGFISSMLINPGVLLATKPQACIKSPPSLTHLN